MLERIAKLFKREYRPDRFGRFKDRVFYTVDKSAYTITPDKRIFGGISRDGEEVLYVAGVHEKDFYRVQMYLDYEKEGYKEKFDKTLLEIGEEPKPGLRLAVSFTPKSANATKKVGLITSLIESVVKQKF